MADMLAVTSLVGQVAESTNKLKDFYERMKDQPEELRHTIYDAEGLRLMLGEIAKSIQQQPFFPPTIKTAGMESLRSCRSCVEGLRSLVEELEDEMAMKKKGRTFKAALKKDKIGELRKQFQEAKSMMLLAKCCYDAEIQRQYLAKIMTDLPHLNKSTLTTKAPADNKRVSDVEEDTLGRRTNGSQERIQYNPTAIKTVSRRRRPNLRSQQGHKRLGGLVDFVTAGGDNFTSTLISLELPSWLYAHRYDLYLSKSYQGWDFRFRSYRTVDIDAPIFHYSMAGDVAGLQSLFKEGKASPFEMDLEGRTPLHYAAMYARPAACRFLLENGADANVRTYWHGTFPRLDTTLEGEWYPRVEQARKEEVWRGRAAYSTPLHLLTSIGAYLTYGGREEITWTHCNSDNIITEDLQATVEALTVYGDCDTLLEDQFGFTSFHLFTGLTSSLQWLQQHEELMLQNLSKEETWNILWSRILNFGSWTTNSKVTMIREGLPGGKVVKHLAKSFATDSPLSSSGSFLSMIAYEWIRTKEFLNQDLSSEWETLILEFVAAEAGLHAISVDEGIPHTILMKLMHACFLPPKIDISLVLRKWLQVLVKAGVELVDYGQEECALYERDEGSWNFQVNAGLTWASLKGYCTMQILDIQIGEKPEDWHVEWDLVGWDVWEEDGQKEDDDRGEDNREEQGWEEDITSIMPGSWYD